MAGMTLAGFETKRLPEIISESKQQAVPIFQDLLQNPEDVVDVSDSSLIGRLINLQAPSIADLWEALQGVYGAGDPNSAEGIALDNLAQLAGTARQPATFGSTSLVLTMDVPSTVPAGSLVRAKDTGSEWSLNSSTSTNISNYAAGITIVPTAPAGVPQDYTITYTVGTSTSTITFSANGSETAREVGEGLKFLIDSIHTTLNATLVGSVLTINRTNQLSPTQFSLTENITLNQMKLVVAATATESGPLVQQPNTIVDIATPVLNWLSVTNPVVSTPGSEQEIDQSLRERLLTTRSQRASNTWDALYSGLTSLDGVFSVNIEENDTAIEVNGVAPYSYAPVVLGGNDQDIAQVIWTNKPLGISPQGTTTVVVKDVRGTNRDVSFSRPIPIPIYIDITIVLDSSVFPGDGVDRIKQSVIDFTTNTYGIGDDVIYSRLFSPINQVPGHYVNSMTIGTTPSPVGTTNIPIAYNEVASFSTVQINITTM